MGRSFPNIYVYCWHPHAGNRWCGQGYGGPKGANDLDMTIFAPVVSFMTWKTVNSKDHRLDLVGKVSRIATQKELANLVVEWGRTGSDTSVIGMKELCQRVLSEASLLLTVRKMSS
jgi:hypothetical protein